MQETPIVKPSRTRARLESAWNNKSDRPLVLGTYSISMLAKLTAGEYARRLLSKTPYEFPAYLGWSGNRMGDALLDEAGIPKAAREFNLHMPNPPVALSGHPDGVDVDTETMTITVLETKRFTFPTPKAVEEARKQALAYAALLDKRLRMEPPGVMVSFDSPPWGSGETFWIMSGEYKFNIQVIVAGAFEPEIHDMEAPPALLRSVLAEFFTKALMVHGSAEAGNTELADKWDREHSKERPVEDWSSPPEPIPDLLAELAHAKAQRETCEAAEEGARARLRDAMKAARLAKTVGSGISAAWVPKKQIDHDKLTKFLADHGRSIEQFHIERVVREVDYAAINGVLIDIGVAGLEDFKTQVVREDFTVRSAGKKTMKGDV